MSQYPTAVDDNSTLYVPVDASSTKSLETVTTALCTDTDASIQVADTTAGFAASHGVLSIEDEIVIYTGKADNVFTGCIRGAFGTTRVGHLAGASVQALMVSGYFLAIHDAIAAIQDTVGVTGAFNFAPAGADIAGDGKVTGLQGRPVVDATPATGQVLKWDGDQWGPADDIGGEGTGGGVSSVGLSLPSALFTITGSPVSSSGTLTATLKDQTINRVLASPASGAAGPLVVRALVAADLPAGVVFAGTNVALNITGNAATASSVTWGNVTGKPGSVGWSANAWAVRGDSGGPTLGYAHGAYTALASADAAVRAYDLGGNNWAGIGCDGSGNLWFRTGTADIASDARMVIYAGGAVGFTGYVYADGFLGQLTGVGAVGSTLGIPVSNAGVVLYGVSAENWAGIGADSAGDMWFRTGQSGTPDARMVITYSGTVRIPVLSAGVMGTAHGSYTDLSSADAAVRLYDIGAGNWAGIGADSAGNMWFRTGKSGTPDARLLITHDGHFLYGGEEVATRDWVTGQAYAMASSVPTNLNQLTNGPGYITPSALSSYATQSWVTGQSYITAAALSGYATQEWVAARGYVSADSGGTAILSRSIPQDDAFGGPLQIREAGLVGGGEEYALWGYAPRINFHWGYRAAKQFGLGPDGWFELRNQDGGSLASLRAGTIEASFTGDLDGTASAVPWTGVTGQPTALSQFSNDSGFITGLSWAALTGKPTDLVHADGGTYGINISGSAGGVEWANVSGHPTALSDLTNDGGFTTLSAVQALGYQTASDITSALAGYLPAGDALTLEAVQALGYTTLNEVQNQGYVTADSVAGSVETIISGYSFVTLDLADAKYLTQAQADALYLPISETGSQYATIDYVSTTLQGYALLSDLPTGIENVATQTYVDNAVSGAVSQLESEIAGLGGGGGGVTETWVYGAISSALSSYATQSDLSNYYTKDEVNNLLGI